MKSRWRPLLWIIVIPLGLMAILFVIFALLASDTLTFTTKTVSHELPHGKTLNLYRTSRFESYDCHFELQDTASGRIITPKTLFYETLYMSYGDNRHMNTPESRTNFTPLIGAKSGMFGLVSPEEPKVLVLLIDAASGECAVPWSWITEAERANGRAAGIVLLEKLKKDFPARQLVFNSSDLRDE